MGDCQQPSAASLASRRAYRARKEREGLEAARQAPYGCSLLPGEPLRVDLPNGITTRVTYADVLAHAASVAGSRKVLGVVLLSGAQTRAECYGKSYPQFGRAPAWRPVTRHMQEGDTLYLCAFRTTRAVLFPFVKRTEEGA